MDKKKIGYRLIVFFTAILVGTVGGSYLGRLLFAKKTNSAPAAAIAPIAETPPVIDSEPAAKSVPAATPESKPEFIRDSSSLLQSFRPYIIFSENFHASYRDSTFQGSYQLTYPLGSSFSTLKDSKFDRLFLSLIFKENAPKTVNRKSIQNALNQIMKKDVKSTHDLWDEEKKLYGDDWGNQTCTGYLYTVPTANCRRWISFQKVSDYRCGGNCLPTMEYYTIVKAKDPYVMDTTAFVPGFREKLIEMLTDNVMYNFYLRGEDSTNTNREEVRQAAAVEFKGNFYPSLTYSGVEFRFKLWSLPRTSHADGEIPVFIPYRTIKEIFTQKFKDDIGLF